MDAWTNVLTGLQVLFTCVNVILAALLVLVTGAYVYLTKRIVHVAEQTVIETRNGVDATRRAAQAALLSQLLQEYASEEMLDAMRQLEEWKHSIPDDFAERYAGLRRARDKTGHKLDDCRRRVSHYFLKVRLLLEAGLIEGQLVDRAMGVNPETKFGPPKFLLEIVEPLEEAHARIVLETKYDTKTFDFFRKRYGLDIGPPVRQQ